MDSENCGQASGRNKKDKGKRDWMQFFRNQRGVKKKNSGEPLCTGKTGFDSYGYFSDSFDGIDCILFVQRPPDCYYEKPERRRLEGRADKDQDEGRGIGL